MPLIVIAEPDGVTAQRLLTAATLPGYELRMVEDLEAALKVVEAERVHTLVIGPSLVGDLAFELAAYLSEGELATSVFVPAQLDATSLKSALRAGVTDVIPIGEDISEISRGIERAVSAAHRLAATGQGEAAGAGSVKRGKVVTIFSTKGGVGKTVLATNLAVALAKQDKRVAIVDLDLEFGDVGIMLGIKPGHTIYDAFQAFDRLDETMLTGLLETHTSGAKVLLAPVRPEDADGISAARVSHLIDMLAGMFDYVMIDTSPSFSEVVLAALDRSDAIFVLTMMDVASIKNTRISMQKLAQLGYNGNRVRVVLNRADSKVLLELAEVERAVTGPVVAYIPSDRIVPRSVNKGVPVVLDVPKSSVTKAILGLAKMISANGTKEAADVA